MHHRAIAPAGFSTTYATVSMSELHQLLNAGQATGCCGDTAKEDLRALNELVRHRSVDTFHGAHMEDEEDGIWSKHRKKLLEGIFAHLDRDSNGTVSFEELGMALNKHPAYSKLLRLHTSETDRLDLTEVFQAIDVDDNGSITSEEFITFFNRQTLSMTQSWTQSWIESGGDRVVLRRSGFSDPGLPTLQRAGR